MQLNQHLVTTADERTWKFDRKVIFLGEWCRLYDRSDIWSEMDAEVAAPLQLQTEKKSSYINYVQALSANLLIEIAVALNTFHNTNHTTRYWNILLGHWLQRHVAVCFNRYFTIEQALKSYKIKSTTIFDLEEFCLARPDSSSFIWACNDDIWNNALYARALQYMDFNKVDLELIRIEHTENFKEEKNTEFSYRSISKQLIKVIGNYILPRFCKSNDAFIINSYLPKLQEIKLQVALLQCPQLWESPVINAASIDIEKRRKFTVNSGCHQGFEKFVRDLLTDMIPACYLEGYVNLGQQVQSLKWPSKPNMQLKQ
jgi:putative transferase (TIGR04331 family)